MAVASAAPDAPPDPEAVTRPGREPGAAPYPSSTTPPGKRVALTFVRFWIWISASSI